MILGLARSADTTFNFRNVALRDAKLAGDVYLSNASGQSGSNEVHFDVGNTHRTASLTSRHPSLRNSVTNVIARSPWAHMRRFAARPVFVRAGRIVHVAGVKEHRALWLRTPKVRQSPCEGVRLNLPTWREFENSVVGSVVSRPKPAPASIFVDRSNLRPEPVLNWLPDHTPFYLDRVSA